MKKYIALLLCCLISAKTEATTLHALLVGDTSDKKVGLSVRQDLYNMTDRLYMITDESGIALNRTLIVGGKVNPLTIFEVLEDLQCNSNDVILFYYSGHGFRTEEKKESPLPYLFCSEHNEGFAVEEVLRALCEKEPRLLIILTDVCNNFVRIEDAPPLATIKVARSIHPNSCSRQNFRELFLNAEGTVIATSSQAGEFSICDAQGGYFSRAFFESLDDVTKRGPKEQVNWNTVMSQTYTNTVEKTNCEQHPTIILDLGPR